MNIQEVFSKQKELASAKAFIEQEEKALITPMFQAIFDAYSDIQNITIRGWTPGFNDGDPCRHNTGEPLFNRNLSKRYDEGEYESKWDKATVLISSFTSVFETAYGTNWEIVVTRNENSIKITKERYYVDY